MTPPRRPWSGPEKAVPGSAKRSKKWALRFMRNGSSRGRGRFLPRRNSTGYRDYDFAGVKAGTGTISAFRLAEYVREDGSTLVGQGAPGVSSGPLTARCWWATSCISTISAGCPSPLIHEQLREWGIDISTGQLPPSVVRAPRDLSGRTAAGACGWV